MPLPEYQAVTLPLLTLASQQPVVLLSDALAILSDGFHLSDEERSLVTASGKAKMRSRVEWAPTYLVQARLVSRPKPGAIGIMKRGEAAVMSTSWTHRRATLS